jgi:hypothetical protein
MSDDGAPTAPARRTRAYIPTDDERFLVTVLHRHGISQKVIAQYVNREQGGIDQKTLRKVFRRELNDAVERVKANMIAALVRSALNGNVSAQKFWLARFGGPEWRAPDYRDDDDDLPPGTVPAGALEEAGGGGMVITIIGGLPPRANGSAPTLEGKVETETEDGDTHVSTNGSGKTNGSGSTD